MLSLGETKKAGGMKKRLEEKQREAKKEREKRGLVWVPRFFVPASAVSGPAGPALVPLVAHPVLQADDDPNGWQFNGRYWAMHEARIAAVEGRDVSDAKGANTSNGGDDAVDDDDGDARGSGSYDDEKEGSKKTRKKRTRKKKKSTK